MEYKGALKGFPKHIVEEMLDEQERQGNERNITVFESDIHSTKSDGGFTWYLSIKGWGFWNKIIEEKIWQSDSATEEHEDVLNKLKKLLLALPIGEYSAPDLIVEVFLDGRVDLVYNAWSDHHLAIELQENLDILITSLNSLDTKASVIKLIEALENLMLTVSTKDLSKDITEIEEQIKQLNNKLEILKSE